MQEEGIDYMGELRLIGVGATAEVYEYDKRVLNLQSNLIDDFKGELIEDLKREINNYEN